MSKHNHGHGNDGDFKEAVKETLPENEAQQEGLEHENPRVFPVEDNETPRAESQEESSVPETPDWEQKSAAFLRY